jgi:hypothetical protein
MKGGYTMTYEEGCRIADKIKIAGTTQVISKDVTKYSKDDLGFIISKYEGSLETIVLNDGMEFYLNHNASVCEVRKFRTEEPEEATQTAVAEETVATTTANTQAVVAAQATVAAQAAVAAQTVAAQQAAAQTVVAQQATVATQTVVAEQASTVAQAVNAAPMMATAQAVGAAPIVTATQTVNTASTTPSGWSVVTESTNVMKEASMGEQNTTLDPTISAEYNTEMTQLTATLYAFQAKLENDKAVSEQALKNFIANPLEGNQADISYHAARLSYSKEMLDRLHAVSVTLSL